MAQQRLWQTNPTRERGLFVFHPSLARRVRVGLLTLAWAACLAGPIFAQDNPVLRELLTQRIVSELARHDSESTAWHNEKSKDKQQWAKANLFGRHVKVRLASWTEQSKTWLWLEDPAQSLSVDLRHFAVREGRVEFSLVAVAKARFKAWGRVPKLAQGSAGGSVWLKLDIQGSTAVGDGRLEQSNIAVLKGEIRELQFNNQLGGPVEGLVEDWLNARAEHDNEKLRHSLEKSIDRVQFLKAAASAAGSAAPAVSEPRVTSR